MKLASLRHGRDGRLVVVSRSLAHCVAVPDIAPTLQAALDDWPKASPKLAEVSRALNDGRAPGAGPFDPAQCAAPLPRAYQWADGSAYVTHVELVRKARGAEMPPSFWTDPLIYQGGSDGFIGPTDAILAADEAWGIDFEAEVAAITDDVPMGADAVAAAGHIRLLMLVNDVSLRNVQAVELHRQFGFTRSKPASAFSPVCVTTDELGSAWRDSRLHLPIRCFVNGKLFGDPNAGEAVHGFDKMISFCAMTQALTAGTIVGGGTVSNQDPKRGYATIAEARAVEEAAEGEPKTPFLKFGDRVRIEMLDETGQSIFGAIDHKMAKAR